MGLRYLSLLPSTAVLLTVFNLICLSSGLPQPLFRHPNLPRNANKTVNAGMSRNNLLALTSTEIPLDIQPNYTPPVDMIVRLHKKARLRCELFDYWKPIHSPTWLRSNKVVVGDSAKDALVYRFALDFATGDLHIANVKLEDAGLWQCAERDPKTGHFTITSRPIHVIVTDPPKMPYLEVDGRRLDSGNQFIPLVEKAHLSMWCIVEGGLPAPSITWNMSTVRPALPLRVQQPLSISGTNGTHQQLRNEARISRLLREHHNAIVTCKVHHESLDKPLSVSVRLDVQYSAAFAIRRYPAFGYNLIEGIPVSFKCDVDSNPPTKPIWLKDNGPPPVPQSVDGYLNFSAVLKKHAGWYKCTNLNASSNGIFLSVRSLEEGSESEHHIELIAGGAIRLECPISSPGCWGRLDTGFFLTPAIEEPEEYPENVIYEYIAPHRCVRAASPWMEALRSEMVEGEGVDQSELGAPVVFPPNVTLNVHSGQRVELKLEFCANPPPNRAFWLAGRHVMTPGDSNAFFVAHNFTPGSSLHCYNAVLSIRKIRPKGAGEYVLLLRNSKGLAEGIVVVNVTGTAGYTEPSDEENNMAPANTLYRVAMLSFLSMFLLKILVL